MNVIDSHCHLQDPAFDADREEVWMRAKAAGIGAIVPGYDLKSSEAAVRWTADHEGTWALVGIHPHDAATWSSDAERCVRAWLREPKVIGIGEIGLDYHYLRSSRDDQRRAFESQLGLAKELNLPVSVHSRDAEADTLSVIQSVGVSRGVLHCFTGSSTFAEALLGLGWHLSFSGIITFKTADALRHIVAWVPWDALLVETDAPYLTPVPWRGRRNEPEYVVQVANAVAEQKKCDLKKVFEATMANTKNVYFDLSGG
jgi:TatD DNase family protein